MTPDIKVGQIWTHPSREYYVRVVALPDPLHRSVAVGRVVRNADRWDRASRSRITYPSPDRFNGKLGGYALHEDVT